MEEVRTYQPLLQAACEAALFSFSLNRLRSPVVAEPPVYFAFTGGRQIGPLHFAELADLAARGVLQPDDLAWKSGTPEWVPASQLLAFPKRKTASGIRETLNQPPPAAEPDVVLAPPDVLLPAPTAPVRPPSSHALPAKWPRVTLAKGSDEPGLRPAETPVDASARTGASDEGDPAAAEVLRGPSRLGAALPVRRLNDAAVLGSPVTWALVFFGLGPLFVSAVAEDPLLRIRLFDFGCGALWVAFFYAAFRTDAATSRTVLAVFFGAVLFALLYFGVLVGWPPVSTLAFLSAPEQGPGARLLGALGGVALVQEVGKLALLLFIARPLKELNGAADGLFHGLISGAAFGLCASLVQTWSFGAGDEGALRAAGDPQTMTLYAAFLGTAVRALAQPFLHAVWTAIAGTFLAQGLPSPGRDAAPGRIFLGIGLAVVFHGLYEALSPPATAFFSVLVAAAALLLLLALKREAEEQPILTALR